MRIGIRIGMTTLGIVAALAVSCLAQQSSLVEVPNSDSSSLGEVTVAERANTEESIRQFENRIRPILVQHCYECHSSETEDAGGLLLDTREALRAGGDSGPSIKIGDSAQSLLIRAISYSDPNLQMPPTGKLDAQVVADFQAWIDKGAVDPRTEAADNSESISNGKPSDQREMNDPALHWSYQPLPSMEALLHPLDLPLDLPPGKGTDAFIDRQLIEKNLEPAGPAIPEVLVRRLTYDLTGLPPTAEQIARASSGNAEDVLEELLDQLLSSPHYGEAMARRWMDVVRYADSITLRGFILPQAWRYRDYLIAAFNEDRSFETMIHEQIAGDLLDSSDIPQRQQQLIATGFLALGNTNLEQQDKQQLEMDYLDEQLDVLGAVFLGQTLGCARCHDHKFDPISTKDYYAMAGILRSSAGMKHANVSEWIEQPLPLEEPLRSHFEALEKQQAALQERLKQQKKQLDRRQKPTDKIPPESLPGVVIDNAQAKLVGRWVSSMHTLPLVGNDYVHDANESRGDKSATFEPMNLAPGEYEVRFAYQPGSNRSSRVIVKVFSADGDKELVIDQRKPPPEQGLWVSLGNFRFEPNGQGYVLVSNQDADGHVVLDAVQFLPISKAVAARVPSENGERAGVSSHSSRESEAQRLNQAIKATEQELSAVVAALRERPKYLTVLESGTATDLPVHVRGSVHSLGELVPRGFPTALKLTGSSKQLHEPISEVTPVGEESQSTSTAPTTTSLNTASPNAASLNASSPNRLDLARWIGDSRNPLTARVYVNRIWLWLMGRGLVDTPNNFGTTGEDPSHPELLDWLALRLIDSGWSTKAIVREIVSSRAYQRALGDAEHPAILADPDNRTYCRGTMRRLPAEALRDAMLVVSGELDWVAGGSIIHREAKNDFDYQHQTTRRSIYHPVFRNSLPELFEQFDFADPSASIGKRARSTHALQGLGLANNPWVVERSQQAAVKWSQRAQQVGTPAALNELWLASLGRNATDDELRLCLDFLNEVSPEATTDRAAWAALVQSVFSSLDFRFLE